MGMENLAEFGTDGEVDILLDTEEALTEEDADWLRWLALDFDDDGYGDDYGDECIEADHTWIRRGC